MKNRYINNSKHYVVMLLAALLVIACAPAYKSIDFNKNTGLVWPNKPAQPRISHVASFYHPEQLGMERGFFTWLSDFISGEEERRLIRPMAITKTAEEVLFVADPGVKGVHRFDLIKKRYSLIRRADNQALPSPVGITTDEHNNVYIIDSELSKLYKIEQKSDVAVEVSLDSKFVQPTSITADTEESSLYITDTGAHHIKKFSYNGKLLKIIGKRGKGKGEFNYPTMIWLDSAKQLYVTDALNFRIQILDRKGDFISYFGKQGDSTGTLSRPKGVATDRYGHVYVVDALFHVFQLFDQKGNFLLHVGGQGQDNGQFWLPTGIFVSDKNEIYIADSHNRRVQVFRYIGGQS